MTKDILISIVGLQDFGKEDDTIELVTTGKYFYKNNKHYIIYDEVMEDTDHIINNTIKVSEDKIQIDKKGIASTQLIFEKGVYNVTDYVMEFGEIRVGISAKEITIESAEDSMDINISYSLEINGEHISDCNIKINIKSMNNK